MMTTVGQQPSPFDPPLASARWLREATASLGVPETRDDGDEKRWTWRDGTTGVIVRRRSHTWQVFAYTPRGSVNLQSASEPTERQIRATVNLADLTAEPLAAVA